MNFGAALDKAIAIPFPGWAAKRALARSQFSAMEAGRLDRTTKSWKANAEAGDPQDLGRVQRSRNRARDLVRNNPHARKVIRAILSQVIGNAMRPDPQAMTAAGRSDDSLRKKLKQLWERYEEFPMLIGPPGRGGCHWGGLQALILREIIVAGEVLIRIHRMDVDIETRRSKDVRRAVPIALEVIEAERLAEDASSLVKTDAGNTVFRGIEVNGSGERLFYHIYDWNPNHPMRPRRMVNDTKRIPAGEILHLYLQEEVTQLRGLTWFAPIVLQLRDVSDYQYNELMASTIAACFAVMVKVQPGAGTLGLQAPSGQTNSDDDGNNITRVQPGMISRLNPGEDVVPVNPMRPGANAEPFINHLLRGVAAGMPGVKSSTVIGDYRESSFASERAADNDCWRETEFLQHWFACSFCQPIYSLVVETAMDLGMLDGRVATSDMHRLTHAHWSAPKAKSINPSDDAAAAKGRMANGQTTAFDEAAAIDSSFLDTIDNAKVIVDECEERGLPKPLVYSYLGLDPKLAILEKQAEIAEDAAETAAEVAKTKAAQQPADGRNPSRNGRATANAA